MKSKPPLSEMLAADLAAIDLPAAETRLAEAEQRRQDLLISSIDDTPIIAVEAEIQSARIHRDRCLARTDDLQRRVAEAREAEAAAVFQAEYDAAARLAEKAERTILDKYPDLANAMIEVAELERQADESVAAINARLVATGSDLAPIQTAATRIWGSKFVRRFRFREILSLPETPHNPAHGAAAELVTSEAAFALGGIGQARPFPVHAL